ncbi:MAG: KpsF/GutQ family sugar-phosphate isomerase [Syntrophales bacterium]|jgi:arabinose-5-phosphate isomerase|nr:KpsF/GutQ family sugar-phosphate isomerase [Syntrophales bacterium]MDY0044927.1 KpsF/GutQ family sugar-phosphate isomerase [Syntrophales bacterium]
MDMVKEEKRDDSIAHACEVLQIEADCISDLIHKVDQNFQKAVDIISSVRGRVIVSGLGKSGLIGKKIVATLTSMGTPAIFLHPVEGLHGDLGIVTIDDAVLAISNSGETQELNTLTLSLREIGVPLISFTGNITSTLARSSDACIDVSVTREACPFGLAPTSSSTAALAMGDALAVALMKKKRFTEEDFYRFHPGGSLGLRLLAQVKEAMIMGERIPKVLSGTLISDAVQELDEKNFGFVLITSPEYQLLGILTDGDLRRSIRKGIEMNGKSVDDFMTVSPRTISPTATLAEAVQTMQRQEITTLVVVDTRGILEGCIHLHDILGRGGTIRISLSQEV